MSIEATTQLIITTVLEHYPAVQGIYLFGSSGTENEWPDSDVDIAILLPHKQAKEEKNIIPSRCRFELEHALHKEVDLLNARLVSTVFQKEIISGGTLIYCADRYAVMNSRCWSFPTIRNSMKSAGRSLNLF